MNLRENISYCFQFSRRERTGIAGLVLLLLLSWFLPEILPASPPPLAVVDSVALINISGKERLNTDNATISLDDQPLSRAAPFAFDPNTLEADGWKKLGIREKTIQTIRNYLSKGGKFYKATDLQRIYGFRKDDYDRLEPYIRIPEQRSESHFSKENPLFVNTEKKIFTGAIDINTCDTSALIALPGIGSKLAGRIVSFRSKLGGFHHIEQVAETYGLADSVFERIKSRLMVIPDYAMMQIDINAATKEELAAHPYVNWSLARVITAFREQHGRFLSVDDLKKITILSETDLKKLRPYLKVSE